MPECTVPSYPLPIPRATVSGSRAASERAVTAVLQMIDSDVGSRNLPLTMEADDLFPSRRDDPLTLLQKEDIDRLSVDELDARVAALEAEITRAKARRAYSVNHKATAEALFKK